MLRKVLIVDDSKMNRLVLNSILRDDYAVAEACNGQEALDMLAVQSDQFSAVLLDIKMPVLDGFGVLSGMQKDPQLSQIPVIVTTVDRDSDTEIRALELGANDFALKPYNTGILKTRLKNLINLRETAAFINSTTRDNLTGLLNRSAFFRRASEMIESKEPSYYVMGYFNINNFKIINDKYGNATGDAVLIHIAKTFSNYFDQIEGIFARITEDKFAALYPMQFMDSKEMTLVHESATQMDGLAFPISFCNGRYIVEDTSLSASAIYDRAVIAGDSIRGRFDQHIALYDESMRTKMLKEESIIGQMKTALKSNQFAVWFQPQYNHASGAMIGAEALVRWIHPDKGMISPGEFIPVFEKNGFIYTLDRYVWEQVCRHLKRWMQDGLNPLPVSVNISRYDILHDDLVDTITGLIEQYELPASLLRLEITESAFSESTNRIITVAKELLEKGFTLEIDDFGSGYSSLNTLKDVPAQVVKLDMRFLEGDDNSGRGGNIIESVVRMTKWLGMSVLAEGVETREQADYLKSIGCYYVQGYYYAKPMPEKDYLALSKFVCKEKNLLTLDIIGNYSSDSFWNPNSLDTLIFNSYVGAACIFEFYNREIELIRATDRYIETIGSTGMTLEDALALRWSEHVDPRVLSGLQTSLKKSLEKHTEVSGDFIFYNLPGCSHKTYFHSILKVIASVSDRYLVYCTNENITAQKEAESESRKAKQKIHRLTDDLTTLMNDAPGGYVRFRVYPDGTGTLEYLNEGFCRILGMETEEVLQRYKDDIMSEVHPDDLIIATNCIKEVFKFNGRTSAKYRLKHKNGEYIWLQMFGRMTQNEEGSYFLNAYYTDLSPQDRLALSFQESVPVLLNALMESTTDLAFAKNKDFNYLCCSNSFARLAGLTLASDIIGKSDYDIFPKEIADHYRRDDIALLENGESIIDKVELLPSANQLQRYSKTSKYILKDSLGNTIGLYGSGQDVTESRLSHSQLEMLNNSIPGGIATYLSTPDNIIITYYNDGFCDLLECTREQYAEHIKTSCYSLIFKEDFPILLASINAMKENGTPIDCTYRIHTFDHSKFKWVNLRGNSYERYGDTFLVHTVSFDVTNLKNAEQQALENQEALQRTTALVDDSSSAVYVCDRNTHQLLYVNQQCANMCHKSVEESFGLTCHAYLKGFANPCENCYMEQSSYEHYSEHEYISPATGKIYLTKGRLIHWGNHEAMVQYLTDETERIQASLTLEADQRAMEMASANGGISFWRYDIDKRLMFWNGAQQPLFWNCPNTSEISPEYIVTHQLIHKDDISAFLRLFTELESDVLQCEDTIRFYNNLTQKYMWIHMIYTRLKDSSRMAMGCCINVDLQQEVKLRYEHEQMLRNDLVKDCILSYELNLNTEMISNYQTKLKDIENMKNAEPITDEIRESILQNTLVADRKLLRDNLFSDSLRNAYQNGTTTVSIKYRRIIPDKGIHWVKGTATMMKQPNSDNLIAFLYFKDINAEEIKLQALDGIIEAEIDSAMLIHIPSNAFFLIKEKEYQFPADSYKGLKYEDFIRMQIENYVLPDDRPGCIQFFSLEHLISELNHEDSLYHTYDVKGTGRKLLHKRVLAFYLDECKEYIVLSRKDVTKVYRQDQKQKLALKKAVQTANDANQAKSDFLSHMSHDMRTPMNAIIGLVNLAKEDNPSPHMMELLSNIDASSRFLLGLINDVLDLSKIEHGKVDLHEEPYSLEDFKKSINTVILPLVQSKNITFNYHMDCDIRCILVDPLRFIQIFFNLLSNAVKYTPDGGHVEFFAEQIPAKDNKVGIRYHVKDNGRGMTKAFQSIAFDPFSQEQEDAVNTLQGTGLGLSIVKNLVTLMGGTIKVESELGKGTEFIIDLYSLEVAPLIKENKYTQDDYLQLKGLIVLLVDDNELNLMITQKILMKYGIVVETARNGMQAAEIFLSSEVHHFDIILMDIRMPVMGGIKATQRIRSFQRMDAETVPIVAMTADAFSDDKDKTLRAGMNAHITKPIEPELLYDTILNLTKR